MSPSRAHRRPGFGLTIGGMRAKHRRVPPTTFRCHLPRVTWQTCRMALCDRLRFGTVVGSNCAARSPSCRPAASDLASSPCTIGSAHVRASHARRRCPRAESSFPLCRPVHGGRNARVPAARRCQRGPAGDSGHVHDPPHQRLPRPARSVGQQPGDRARGQGRQRRPDGRRRGEHAARRRRRRDAGLPALQPPAGQAHDRGVQRDGLRRRDLREPRVRLGPDGPRRSRDAVDVPPRVGQHRGQEHRGLRDRGLGQAGLRVGALRDQAGRDRSEHREGRLHRRHDPGDADDHDRLGHRGHLLQGPGRLDPPLLRRDEVGGRRRDRGAEPPRLRRRRVRIRHPGLR